MSDLTHYEKTVAERIRLVAEYDPPDMAGVASLLGLPLNDAADFVTTYAAAIDATAQRMAIKGNLLEPKARKLAQKLLDRMLMDVDSLDPLEAADLIKHPYASLRTPTVSALPKRQTPTQTCRCLTSSSTVAVSAPNWWKPHTLWT